MSATRSAPGRSFGSSDQHASTSGRVLSGVFASFGRRPDNTWFTTAASGMLANGVARS